MKDVIVTRKKYHIVRSLPGCTVRQEGANGTVIETTVPADEDTPVFAHSGRWAIEGDENVTVTEVFNGAPSGGGAVKILADETLVSSLASKAGNNTFTGSNVFTQPVVFEGDSSMMSVVDLRGMTFEKISEYAIKYAAAWYTEKLYILADNTTHQPYKFFKTMKSLFGVSNTIKKIIHNSLGTLYHGSVFYGIKNYTPNISYCVVCSENGTGSDFDSWNLLEVNADFFEHYCPKKKIHMRGMGTSTIGSMKLTALKLEMQDTGWQCLMKNLVRELNIENPENASYVFYSADSTLKVAKVNDGFWEKVKTANYTFYGAKNLLSASMYPAALPLLTQAENMFAGCELKGDYVVNLLASLPSYESGTHALGLGVHVDYQNAESVIEAISAAEAKGWTLTVQWNGTATAAASMTYGMRKPPIFARVSERELSDGTTERTLDWGHYVTDPEGYEEFSSVEEAREHYGLPDESLTETE